MLLWPTVGPTLKELGGVDKRLSALGKKGLETWTAGGHEGNEAQGPRRSLLSFTDPGLPLRFRSVADPGR